MTGNGHTMTSGKVAALLGVRIQAIHEFIADGLVAPTVPPRKQGSPSRWSAEDVEVLRAALAARTQVDRAAPVAAQAAQRLRSAREGTVLAIGPKTARPVRGGETVADLIRLLGSPVILVPRV